ncbi:MAG TPA: hypothetical protein VFW75_06540 [Acetobacteraceae bacterium]|nr:hypothetical protein [Acetobacteraceae bacterium]
MIDAINDKSLQATSRDGDKLSIALPADLSVTAIVRARITDIRSGSYIGTAAIPQPDGTLRALEVQVFPERMRGVGEGSHPYDLRPGSTMTNGAAGDVVGTQGRTLTLRYKGGEKRLVVPENAPIITYEPGTRAMLVPGAHVIVTAAKDAAGGLTATRVAVGRNGLTPPM